jgi:hypothetical protein
MRTSHIKPLLLLASCAAALAGAAEAADPQAAPAAEEDGIVAAIKAGKPIIDVRYRFEWKDQAGFAENAYANTIRTRLGYETGDYHGFKFLLEFENVATIGDDHFNSTTNGRTQFPVIPDPNATEINRAQVSFTGIPKTTVTLGRQKFDLLNQRFVGAVDFRQNQQTFDALRVTNASITNLTVDYLYLSRIHKVFGDDNPLGDIDSDSHVLAATYDGGPLGKLTGYGLLLDFEETPAASSATWGLRYAGTKVLDKEAGFSISLVGEFALQRDYANNPFDYDEAYVNGEATVAVGRWSAILAYERLGGDGAIGFSTPLATLHKFQGFADVFLTTPAAGVEDLNATVAYQWKSGPFGADGRLYAVYHDFESERGGVEFGREVNAGVNLSLGKHWSAEIKGAIYDGRGAFPDRSIIWSSVRFQY